MCTPIAGGINFWMHGVCVPIFGDIDPWMHTVGVLILIAGNIDPGCMAVCIPKAVGTPGFIAVCIPISCGYPWIHGCVYSYKLWVPLDS